MTKCRYNGKITTYNDISTTYDCKTTAYNDKRTAYNDKSTVYNIINSTYNERSTISNKKSLHIMGPALHIIKQIDIRQSWRSISQGLSSYRLGRATGGPWIADLRCWTKPEVQKRSWFLVLTKRSTSSEDENALRKDERKPCRVSFTLSFALAFSLLVLFCLASCETQQKNHLKWLWKLLYCFFFFFLSSPCRLTLELEVKFHLLSNAR